MNLVFTEANMADRQAGYSSSPAALADYVSISGVFALRYERCFGEEILWLTGHINTKPIGYVWRNGRFVGTYEDADWREPDAAAIAANAERVAFDDR